MPNNKLDHESSLDTGTGGFNIDDKVQTFDVGVETYDQSKVTFTHGKVAADAGFLGPDGKPADLSIGTKKTLSDYLSNLTRAKGKQGQPDGLSRRENRYPVGEIGGSKEVSLVDALGKSPGIYSTDPTYYATSTTGGPAMLSRKGHLPAPDYKNEVAWDASFVRGASSNLPIDGKVPVDGHDLLRKSTKESGKSAADGFGHYKVNFEGLDPVNPAAMYTNLLLTNRFTQQQPNIYPATDNSLYPNYENSLKNSGAGGDGKENINYKQFVKGYDKGTSQKPTGARSFSMGQLAQIGTILGIRASGEPNSDNPMSTAGMNVEETTAILPGSSQSGLAKIRLGLLEAKDVLTHLTDDSAIQGSQLVSITPDLTDSIEGASWGSLNSALDQYSGASNFGMMLLSAAMIIATTVVIAGIPAIIVARTPGDPMAGATGQGGKNDPAARASDRRLPIGSSTQRSAPGGVDIKSLLNIARTNNDYFLCVRTGVFAFFGLGDFTNGSQVGAALLSALVNSVKTPEHTVIQARAFLRSFLVIADSMKSVVAAFESNPLAGSKQILNFTNVLIHSRFLGAVNTFAVLGDAVLSFSKDTVDEDASAGGFGRKISRMDTEPKGNAHTKNRLGLGKTLTLAWSSMMSIDMLVSNRSRGVDALEDNKWTFKDIQTTNPNKRSGPRLDPEQVSAFETILDGEYFPFYFHDLRTNEMVSFHAFLATLGESYTATYDTVEGFGRVDPVKIYKNTHRKIDLSFYIAATNDHDFSVMWDKINKLTTLMYPQYTEGKQINAIDASQSNASTTKNYKFFAPFSQQISASPMIRLRVGDLIRSNYSKYNLARMFGYENPNAQFGKFTPVKIPYNGMNSEHFKTMLDVTYSAGNDFMMHPDAISSIKSAGGVDANNNSINEFLLRTSAEGLVFKFQELVDSSNSLYKISDGEINERAKQYEFALVKYKVGVNTNATVPQQKAAKDFLTKFFAENYKNDIENKKSDGFFIFNNELFYHATPLSFRSTPEQKTKNLTKVEEILNRPNAEFAALQTAFQNTLEPDNISTKKFMASDNNIIVKSFASVGGKGLPGFIDSMNFDWHEKVTWAGIGSLGPKAPKICKVTISFTPIHDISPGLDASGANRAPIYPIAYNESLDIFPEPINKAAK
jgi:hypothetical protein